MRLRLETFRIINCLSVRDVVDVAKVISCGAVASPGGLLELLDGLDPSLIVYSNAPWRCSILRSPSQGEKTCCNRLRRPHIQQRTSTLFPALINSWAALNNLTVLSQDDLPNNDDISMIRSAPNFFTADLYVGHWTPNIQRFWSEKVGWQRCCVSVTLIVLQQDGTILCKGEFGTHALLHL